MAQKQLTKESVGRKVWDSALELASDIRAEAAQASDADYSVFNFIKNRRHILLHKKTHGHKDQCVTS